jgi:hypothetical protein
MQSTPPAPTRSAPRPARKRWRNTKTPPQANASKENSEAAAAKKHKTVTAAKRYGDALAIQEACIQACVGLIKHIFIWCVFRHGFLYY